MSLLLVDDDQDIIDILADILGTAGFRVVSADGPDAALRILAEKPIDVVLSDIRMPGGSGIDLVKQIAIRWPKVRIVLMSGYSSAFDETHSLPWEVIRKPSRMIDVIAAVKRAKAAPC